MSAKYLRFASSLSNFAGSIGSGVGVGVGVGVGDGLGEGVGGFVGVGAEVGSAVAVGDGGKVVSLAALSSRLPQEDSSTDDIKISQSHFFMSSFLWANGIAMRAISAAFSFFSVFNGEEQPNGNSGQNQYFNKYLHNLLLKKEELSGKRKMPRPTQPHTEQEQPERPFSRFPVPAGLLPPLPRKEYKAA